MAGVPACESSVLCNGAYKWLLDCDLKCPVIMEILSCVYDIYHMYILATYLGELMKIMVVCADQKDGILYAAFMDTIISSTNFLNSEHCFSHFKIFWNTVCVSHLTAAKSLCQKLCSVLRVKKRKWGNVHVRNTNCGIANTKVAMKEMVKLLVCISLAYNAIKCDSV